MNPQMFSVVITISLYLATDTLTLQFGNFSLFFHPKTVNPRTEAARAGTVTPLRLTEQRKDSKDEHSVKTVRLTSRMILQKLD